MEIFSLLFDSQHTSTVMLYILIFAFTTIFAFAANKRERLLKKTYKQKRINCFFLISFLIAWFFYAFGNVGADLTMYRSIYASAKFSDGWILGAGLETGYRVLNALLHSIVGDEYIGISLIKTIQIILVFASIWMIRDRIHIGYAVMAYMALFYFEAFNLIRISLAAGVCMVSIALLINKKTLMPLLLAILAMSIHTASIVFLVAIIGYLIYQKMYQVKILIRIAVIVAVPVVVLLSGQIISILVESGYFMDRYSDYTTNASSIGVMQIVFYFPVFANLYSLKKLSSDKQNREFYDILFIFSICGFAVAMCGYTVGMLARAAVYFFVPFGVLLPFYIKARQDNMGQGKKIFSLRDCKVLYVIYFLFRFTLGLSGYYFVSKLYDYELVFGSMV